MCLANSASLYNRSFTAKKACVVCYGQSGTGKTYTMSNVEDVKSQDAEAEYKDYGIIPRVKTMIFRGKTRLEELGYDMNVEGCCYEIYNNELWSLKADGNEKKSIAIDPRAFKEHSGFETLSPPSDFDALIKIGAKNWHIGVMKLNDTSSRSHFIISLETRVSLIASFSVMHEGLLNLVDLVGSEQTQKAGIAGVKLQEGISINTSL
ncbi:P-loop containing nucleoside triphosphate hydrolase protein [Hypoxylon sp. FL0890]|nr:P-loop containing nucleoside triphosphate hydrolase protein [Hypoxylon sp. FL0890]